MTTTTHGSFVLERHYAASPRHVFAAWSDPVAKRAWFVEGEGWEILSYKLDFREGGSETSRFRFLKGEEIFGEPSIIGNDTVFNEVIPNERIIFTYSMDRNGKRFSVSLATVEFRKADKGTSLLFTEDAAFFEGGDGIKMREGGWTELLQKLEEHLAKGQ